MNLVVSSPAQARRLEHQIVERLLQQKEPSASTDLRRRADRVIGLSVSIVALAVLGSVLQELMWAVLAGGSIVVLGVR